MRGVFESIAHDDDRHVRPRIKAETLVISALLGQEVPSEVGMYVRNHVPNARLVDLAGADHFAFASRAQVINGVVEDFISKSS